MLDLPMKAFKIIGTDGFIELNLDELYDSPAYGGGYGAQGLLRLQTGNYFVKSKHYFTTGELWDFLDTLTRCYNSLEGESNLTNVDNELTLKVHFDKLGKVNISGCFQERPDKISKLIFEINTEQSFIKDTISDLREIKKKFDGVGGSLGE
jgi:hypothetical protein